MSDSLNEKDNLLTRAEFYERRLQKHIRNNWLQRRFSTYSLDIVDNEGNGDCFFASIRDAFKTVKRIITVQQLRYILSKHATEDVFLQHKMIYDSIIDDIKKSKHTDFNTVNMLNEYIFMKDIDTLDKFKQVVQTNLFWANTWAISIIEQVLNTKIIILQKEYKTGVLCGQLNYDINNFNPDFYILLNYHGNIHYNLVVYKNKGVLSFKNIPYLIKTAIVDTCMNVDAGPYHIIPEFRNLKQLLEKNRMQFDIMFLKKYIKKLKKILYIIE